MTKATAPRPNVKVVEEEIQLAGIKNVQEAKTDVDRAAQELAMVGYTKIASGFSEEELNQFSRHADAVMERQRAESGGAEHMKTSVEAHIARALLCYDPIFMKVCRHPQILALAEKMMGAPVFLNQQNAILNPPGEVHYVSLYHRDFPWQHFTSSHPLALTVLLCVDDFTLETGPTMVLPGSHKLEACPDEKVRMNNEVPITAPRGTFIIIDSMIFHRTGKNKSDHFRRAIVQVYSIPLIKQVISFPRMLNGQYKDDPELSKFLGYSFETADSALDFRRQRGMVKEGM